MVWSVTPTTGMPSAFSRALVSSSSCTLPTLKAMCCTQAGVFSSRPMGAEFGSSKKASTLPPPASMNRCM
jgi:hypothetical protein